MLHLPAGSVLPKTDVKLLSETNAFVAAAEETDAPLKPILFLVYDFWIRFVLDFWAWCLHFDLGQSIRVYRCSCGCVFDCLVGKTSDENEE